MQQEKIAIVTSGGGMKCSYGAGALVALVQKLGIKEPDIFVSASGSVGNMMYYLAGQTKDVERLWLRYIPSPEAVNIFPPRINLDYLIDTVLRRELPLDIDALNATTTRWFVPVTDMETGHTRYITNDLWLDPYEVMRAAKALPLVYSGSVRLGTRPFIDGGISANMADLLRKAAHEGAKKIICIANTTYTPTAQVLFMHGFALFSKPMLRHLILNDIRRAEWDDVPGNPEILLITPSYPLPLGLITKVRRKLAEAYQMGYADVMDKRKEIEAFLGMTPP